VAGFSGDGRAATQAQLNGPTGVISVGDGTVYICDTGNHRLRKVTSEGKMSTIAGTGEAGWSGDGGQARAAKLNEPYEVRLRGERELFWVERLSHTVRACDLQSGIIRTVAGCGTAGFSGDQGPATKAQLNEPHSIGFDRAGDLYICDVKNHRIRKVTMKSGVISTFAGTGEKRITTDGASISGAPLHGPRALDFDQADNLWLALREGNAVLKMDLAAGKIWRMAGNGKKGYTGDGAAGIEAALSGPKGLSVGPGGDVYLADTENHAIRMVEAKTGKIRTVAGSGTRGSMLENDPLKCQLARPHGIFVDRKGTILIGDTEAHRVLVLRPD
jgi:DNA-binding beta-propeller fold protein YncE